MFDWLYKLLITLNKPLRSGINDRGLLEDQPIESTAYSLQSDELATIEYEIEGIRMQLDDDRSVTNLRACELINDLNTLTKQRHILLEAQQRQIKSEL